MCLAVYSPKMTSFMNDEDIFEAWHANPDGAGISISDGKIVSIMKGFMELKDLMSYIDANRDRLNTCAALLHFRWSTSGGTCPELTHPFPVSNSNEAVKKLCLVTEKAIIHNGVIYQPNIKNYSDTAVFSRWLDYAKPTRKKIETMLGGDRLAIMTADSVELIGDWNEEEGIFYSNTHWRYQGNPVGNSLELDQCPCCDSYDVEFIGRYTETFECMECGAVFNDADMLKPQFDFETFQKEIFEAESTPTLGGEFKDLNDFKDSIDPDDYLDLDGLIDRFQFSQATLGDRNKKGA